MTDQAAGPGPSAHSGARLCLLGPPALGGHPARPLGRNDALLLALLVFEGPQPRSRAAALVWPDHAEAARNLRQRVHQLKKLAGCDVLVGDPLLGLADGVGLDLPVTDDALEALLRAEPGALRDPLLGGVQPRADGELADRLAQWRRRWDHRLQQALHRSAAKAWADGQASVALSLARRLVDAYPADESAHRGLIDFHHRMGDRSAALAAYEHCLRHLRQALGLAPSVETEALMQRVRGQGLPAVATGATDDVRPALSHPPRLVARDAPWQAAMAALDVGQPVLLTGDAGIGKSRLLADLAVARGGWPLVMARRGDADLPYSLLARLLSQLVARHGAPGRPWVADELARLVPGLGAAGAEPFTALRLQRAVQEALSAWSAPTHAPRLHGLALDDLHFADRATLDLLLVLLDDQARQLGCVMAARADELLSAAPAWQAPLDGAGVCVLALAELDLEGLRALLASLPLGTRGTPALAERLWQLTGGNPLFVLQALAAMLAPDGGGAEPLAPVSRGGALAWIARRIERLDPFARQLLRLAAVAHDAFSPALASRVMQQPPLALADAWATLDAARLMQDGHVAHDLVRQAVLQGLPDVLVTDTHAAVAKALAASGAPPALQARHWQAAGAGSQAAAAWEAAADAAAQRSATAEEVTALRAAMQAAAATAARASPEAPAAWVARDDGDDRPIRLGLRLVHALLRGSLVEEARAELQALQPLLQQPLQRLHGLLLHAKLTAEQQQPESSLASADEALTLALALPETAAATAAEGVRPQTVWAWPQVAAEPGAERQALLMLATQRRAMALLGLGRADEALACMPAAMPPPEGLGAEDRLFWLSDCAQVLEQADRRQQAVQANLEVVAEADHQRRWLPAADACANLAVCYLYLGRLEAGTGAAERSIAYSQRAGMDESSVLVDRMNLAGNWRDLGWFDRYLPCAEALPAQLRAAGLAFWAPNAENDLGVAYSWLGRDDLAWRLLSVMDDSMPEVFKAARLITRLRLERDQGARRFAPQPQLLIEQAQRLLDSAGKRVGMMRQALILERAARQPAASGAAQAQAVADEALEREYPLLAIAGLRVRTRLLLGLGDAVGAEASAEAMLALTPAEEQPPSHYAPGLWSLAAQALALRQPERAQALMQRAARWIRAAAAHVPPLYAASFVERNPVNRAVLEAAPPDA